MTITATIIADSISQSGKRITTFELEYPRFIHAELMTHRLFSRNAASSRAIPVGKIIEQVTEDPAMPTYWGSSKGGMQAGEELTDNTLYNAEITWVEAAKKAATFSEILFRLGLHKQHSNRITEPFQQYKVVLTATEFDNFFHLRNHSDAQPEIRVLAEEMLKAMEDSVPKILYPNEWHLPYVNVKRGANRILYYYDIDGKLLNLAQAKKVSASCCAQVSYRLLDYSLEKAEIIFDRLVNSKPVHASPFEHQASPMSVSVGFNHEGVTHMDRNSDYWSGNFKGWIQFRQLIPDNVCTKYDKTGEE